MKTSRPLRLVTALQSPVRQTYLLDQQVLSDGVGRDVPETLHGFVHALKFSQFINRAEHLFEQHQANTENYLHT